jgi:cytochrome c oxidase subunit 2
MPLWLQRILVLPPEASSVAAGIDTLHAAIIAVTAIASCVVFAFIAYCLVRYQSRAAHGTPRIVWSGLAETVPGALLLVIFLAWWVVGFRQYVGIQVPPKQTQDIYVTGKQWMWKFTYADGRSAINELTVPLGKEVKLVMISRDVIHSFYVPAFRLKQDVLPGRYTTLWFKAESPGSYDILCAEYCGLEHSLMRAKVNVLQPADYAAWSGATMQGPEAAADVSASLVQLGARAARKHGCVNCHSVDGSRGIGPTFAALWQAERTLQDGSRVVADGAYITESIMDPLAKVVPGYPSVMPSYWGLVDANDTAALVEYIKSLGQTPKESP